MTSPTPLLLSILLLLLLPPSIHSISQKSLDTGGVPSDIPFIRCQTCAQIAQSATSLINLLSPPLDLLKVLDKVENICDPSTKQGRWMRTIDLVEKARQLRLVPQDATQKCTRECFTMSLACRHVIDDLETELAERLYKLRKNGDEVKTLDIENWLCAKRTGMSDACRKSPPLLPKDRPVGPPFVPKDKKELETEELMDKLKESGVGGDMDFSMLNRDQAANMAADDDDDDDFDEDFYDDDDDDMEAFEDDDDDDDDPEPLSQEGEGEGDLGDTALGEAPTLKFEEEPTVVTDSAGKAAGVEIGKDEL